MPITYGLIAANLSYFISYILNSSWKSLLTPDGEELFLMGAANAPSILGLHEYWRLLASMFLHANLAHLLTNMVVLFSFGRALEKPLGSARFLVIYLVAGFCGAFTSIGMHINREGVGASGAIMGLVSFLLTVEFMRDQEARGKILYRLRQIVGLILAWYFSTLLPDVDSDCHAGGMIGGALCGLAFFTFSDLNKIWTTRDSAITLLSASLLFAVLALEIRTIGQSPHLKAILLMREVSAPGALDDPTRKLRAAAKLDRALKLWPDNVQLLLLHASVVTELRRLDDALADCDRVLKQDPQNKRAVYIKRAIYDYLERLKKVQNNSTIPSQVGR